MFGADAAEAEKPAKKEEKKKEPKKRTEVAYALPLKVVTGIFPDFAIKADDFGKDTITADELHEQIYQKYEQFPKALTQLEVKGMLCKVKQKIYAQQLGSEKRTLEDGWRITLNGFSLPLEEGTEIDLDTVKALWEAQYPSFKGIKCKYLYDTSTKVIVPFILSDPLTNIVNLPATVFLFGQEEITVGGAEEGEAPAEEKPVEANEAVAEESEEADDEDEDEEESEDDESDEESDESEETEKPAAKKDKKEKKYTINDLRKYLSKIHGGMEFAVVKCADGKYMAYPSSAYVDNIPEKKEETYPSDATIGLIFTKIKLCPEFFGGKKEITAKDVCKYLAKDYEEFADEKRVTIIYDKARKLIKPMIAAARKGSSTTIVDTPEAVEEILARDGYQLFNYSEDPKHLWRIEKTPLGTFKMLWGAGRDFPGNSFTFALPKVPEKVWRKMIYLFKKYARYRLEVCCQLLYEVGKGYSIYVPEQSVGAGFVQYNPAPLMQYCIEHEGAYIVADFHSHNTKPAFSAYLAVGMRGTSPMTSCCVQEHKGFILPLIPKTFLKAGRTASTM